MPLILKIPKPSKWFYSFSGFHTFLIGLFIFFIPVYLWKQEFSLSQISFSISFIGLGYLLSLFIFDRIKQIFSLKGFITLSFLFEILTFGSIFFLDTHYTWIFMSLLLGIYNGFFWTIQRLLFTQTIDKSNSGKKYGNFQIFVFLILKISILLGSIVLEHHSIHLLFGISILISFLGILFFQTQSSLLEWNTIKNTQKLSLKDIFHFKDKYRSRFMFLIDGPFLYFESFFWALSLFWILDESFMKLGILVIFLSFAFTILFWITKNLIDKVPHLQRNIYIITVILYGLSWIGRGFINPNIDLTMLLVLLVAINFANSFFRLTFNKAFFDRVKEMDKKYIYLKSYFSQTSIVITFAVLGILFSQFQLSLEDLYYVYFSAGFIALGYGMYKT